jgi:NADPH-dependent 2,4-dienoyl-CoA reductase/sulfur reductase-like enzyme
VLAEGERQRPGRLLQRAAAEAGPADAVTVQRLHEAHGVRFACGSSLSRVHGHASVTDLELADGTRLPVDLVVVGIGVDPDVEWLRDSALTLHRGLRCDDRGRSSDPHVFGAGDVTCRHVGDRCWPGGHWTGASEQAQIVAATLAAPDRPPRPVRDGYFWSDQFDVRLQFAGTVEPGAPVTVTAGSPQERRFMVLFGEPERATAVFAMDCPREFVRGALALRRPEPAGVG